MDRIHRSRSELNQLFLRASREWDLGKLRDAFRLFLAGAKAGDLSAQHNLGYFYDVGIGVKPNRTAALYWYKRAARRGSRTSAANIGTIFRDEKQTQRALAWFQRAVRLGDADANLEIAKLYIRDMGLARKAIPYLRKTINAPAGDATKGAVAEAKILLKRLEISSGQRRRR